METFGDKADPPVLLIGITMLSWPGELCTALAGRFVVRYDLRDAGESTFADPDAPSYDLRDLVSDASEPRLAQYALSETATYRRVVLEVGTHVL
ncbi:hypothetical protein [Catelliglobosispora koreensis]|uniref:hypothetical protein n=1 Tax=Catelliglobosispora koreensis TaxID=129052 RepID=UPI000367ED43|nr:hypothetical protein [Catelliglobosispora koreensis]